MESTEILRYSPDYQAEYKKINVEWISEMFSLEPHDLEQLDQPDTFILPNGGAILLARRGGEIVGTVAMIRTGAGEFELAKMAVTKAARGVGIGRLLCEAAVEYARRMGARRVWLESNWKADTAVRLYERLGFVHLPLRQSLYTRADVHMELLLPDAVSRPQMPASSGQPLRLSA